MHSAVLKSGDLSLTIDNNRRCRRFFQINEFYKNSVSLDTTLSILNTKCEIDLSGYSLILPLMWIPKVNYISNISLPSDQEMTLSLSDSISTTVDMINMAFQSVTGQTTQVTVEIDPVEQSIDALPEELDGFDFEDVEMVLDFTSA